MWRKAEIVFYVALGVSVLADFLIPEREHPFSWWYHIPGFDIAFGVIACFLIIKASKFLAKHWLQRSKDYYD